MPSNLTIIYLSHIIKFPVFYVQLQTFPRMFSPFQCKKIMANTYDNSAYCICLILCRSIDFSIKVETVGSGWSIV